MPEPAAWSPTELAEGSRRDPDLTVRMRGLMVALALAVLVVVGLAGFLYVEHHQTDEERAAQAAVTAYVDAMNNHDLSALQRATTEGGTWEAVGKGAIVTGPYAGQAYWRWVQSLFAQGFHLEVMSPAIVSGGTEVALSTRLRLAGTFTGIVLPHPREYLDEVGVTEFHLVREGGQLKVAEVVWMPPY
ncbi:MAG: Rv0361 family membrane protein [Actinomycetes bacterium]